MAMASTVIGAGLVVEGEIVTDEDVSVAGIVRGKIDAKEGVAIESGATVEADVSGAEVSIAGSLTGNVHATERVIIATGARMIGDVKAARFTIQDGAQFKGHVDMDV
jgi:cytoskeletal protein CcmA (bactofilin family)